MRVLVFEALLLLLMMIAATCTASVHSSSTINLEGFESASVTDDMRTSGGYHDGSVQYAGGETPASLSPGLVLLHGVEPGETQGAFATIVDTISFKVLHAPRRTKAGVKDA